MVNDGDDDDHHHHYHAHDDIHLLQNPGVLLSHTLSMLTRMCRMPPMVWNCPTLVTKVTFHQVTWKTTQSSVGTDNG